MASVSASKTRLATEPDQGPRASDPRSRPLRRSAHAKRRQSQGLIAAVDIGASKTACVIAVQMPGARMRDIEIIGVGQCGAPPQQSRKHVLSTSEGAIRTAVEAAERMAGERIEKVRVGVHGRHLLSRRIGVDLDLAGGAVTREDMMDCLNQGRVIAAKEGAEAIHALPISYGVDGEAVGADPSGLIGTVLSLEMVGLGVRGGFEANLSNLLARCDLEVERFYASPMAAAQAVLIEDEKELGALIIDIGARSCDYAVFEDGALVACGAAPIGGEHITRDIAQIFGCSIAYAERIKALHGSSLIGGGDDHQIINIPQMPNQSDFIQVARSELSAVIAPRMEEMLTLTLEHAVQTLSKRGRGAAGLRRAVLTGGGSLLAGARETAESILGVAVRLGRPMPISGAPDAASAPQFAALIGGLWDFNDDICQTNGQGVSNHEFNGDGSGLSGHGGGLFSGLAHWLKVNF